MKYLFIDAIILIFSSCTFAGDITTQFTVVEQASEYQRIYKIEGTLELEKQFDSLKKNSGNLKQCPSNFTEIIKAQGHDRQTITACHDMKQFPTQKQILDFAIELKKKAGK